MMGGSPLRWTVTDDPLTLMIDGDMFAIDLGAEKIIAAEKGNEKIAIELKTFDQPSLIYEFHKALGQYFNYQTALIESSSNRELFVAIPDSILEKLMNKSIVRKSIERLKMKFIIVNLETLKIVKWIK